MSNEAIKIENVSKTYKGKSRTADVAALKGVSLTLNKGEFLALKGASGCGKSSLLLSAGALMKPDSGKVIINDENPYALSLSKRAEFRAKNIGFVFQSFHLVPYLSVLDNVLVCQLARKDIGDMRDRALNMLEKLGLQGRLNHLPSELSVGEQQRTALARAVTAGASVILADEPTGNLDTENGKMVLQYLADFASEGGAVLMVTHDHNAGDYAFRTIEMNDGQIL